MSQSNKNFFLLLFPLILSGFSCSNAGVHHRSYAHGYGTDWDIHLYEGTKEDADEIAKLVSSTSLILDPKASSISNGLYALNHSQSLDDPDSYFVEAVSLGERVKEESGGTYSFTMGKLSDTWKQSLEKKEVLDEQTRLSLTEEAQATSIQKDGGRIAIIGDGNLDFSSLGKGLCLKHIQGLLQEKNITHYFINAGTSSMLFGENVVNNGYVNVHLEDAEGASFKAKNCALSTSSVAKQGVEIGGTLYSHIIDPRTGRADLGNIALCLVGDDPALLDAYSTAYLIKGSEAKGELDEKGVRYIYMKEGKVIDSNEPLL